MSYFDIGINDELPDDLLDELLDARVCEDCGEDLDECKCKEEAA